MLAEQTSYSIGSEYPLKITGNHTDDWLASHSCHSSDAVSNPRIIKVLTSLAFSLQVGISVQPTRVYEAVMKSENACWLNFLFYCRQWNWSGGRDSQHATNYEQQGSDRTDLDGIREISLWKQSWLSLALAKTTKSHQTASLQSWIPHNSTSFMVTNAIWSWQNQIHLHPLPSWRRAQLRDRLQNRAGGSVLVGCKELPEAFFFFFLRAAPRPQQPHLMMTCRLFSGGCLFSKWRTFWQKKKRGGNGDASVFVITWPKCVNFSHVVTHGCLLWWGRVWKWLWPKIHTDHVTTTEASAIQTLLQVCRELSVVHLFLKVAQ